MRDCSEEDWCPVTPYSMCPVYGSRSVIQIQPTSTGPAKLAASTIQKFTCTPISHPVAASLSDLVAFMLIGMCGSGTRPHGARFLVLQLRHIDRVCSRHCASSASRVVNSSKLGRAPQYGN